MVIALGESYQRKKRGQTSFQLVIAQIYEALYIFTVQRYEEKHNSRVMDIRISTFQLRLSIWVVLISGGGSLYEKNETSI